jgi:hypothetical protein
MMLLGFGGLGFAFRQLPGQAPERPHAQAR